MSENTLPHHISIDGIYTIYIYRYMSENTLPHHISIDGYFV